MARKQAADYDQKRDHITKVAARLFARKGFDGASLSDIAAACNSSKSLIYHYYQSKEAILYDVMTEHIDVLLGAIDEVEADSENSAADNFRRLSRGLMRRYVGAANSQKVLLYELVNLPVPQRREIIDKQRRIVDFAEDLLAQAAPAQSVDREHLGAQAMLFFGMLNWTHNWYKQSGPIGRDEIADMAANAILNNFSAFDGNSATAS